MSRDKTNKVVSMYDNINLLEDEMEIIEEKLKEVLSKKADFEFILMNLTFMDSDLKIDDSKKLITTNEDNVNEMFLEITTDDAIFILNNLLSRRKTNIDKLEYELNDMFKPS